MPKLIDVITNFTSGTLSPLLEGRVDLKKYENSLLECTNFIVKPQGPIIRRAGTEFINNTRNNNEAHLIEFIFNTTQSHILEFTENYMRVFTNGALVLNSSGSPDFVNGTFASDIASWTDASSGASSIAHDAGDARMQLVCGASGQAEARQSIASLVPHRYDVTLDVFDNDITYKVGTTAGASDLGSGTLTTGSKTFNFYSGSNTTIHFSFVNATTSTTAEVDNIALSASPYELSTSWTLEQIKQAGFTQSADELYLVHEDLAPQVLSRTADDNWSIADVDFSDGPYLDQNLVEPSNPQLSTIFSVPKSTAESQTLTSSTSIFTSADVGRMVRFRGTVGRPYGWGKITSYTSGTEVTVDWQTQIDGTESIVNGTFDDSILGWSDISSSGSISYDSGNNRMRIDQNEGASQSYIANYRGTHTIAYTVSGTGNIEIGVGSTAGYAAGGTNEDITSFTSVSGSGTITFDISANAEEVFINIRKTTAGTGYLESIEIYTQPNDSSDWFLGAWGDRSTLGYPRTARFYEQRLLVAGSTGQPQTFWASQSGDFTNFSPDGDDNNDDITDRSSINYTLADEKLNTITWISSQGALIFHTTGPVFVASATEGGPITPTNIAVTKAVSETSAEYLRTVSTATTTVFVHGSKKIVFDIAFDFQRDGYAPRQLTRLADQFSDSQITQLALQDSPDKVIWFTREDGTILTLTFERDENVVAWTKHELGGTDTKALSIATIPSTTRTEVWTVVERTIDGSTVRFVERFKPEFRYQDIEDAFFVDSGLTYDGSSATIISGLDHLEGETVKIIRDGVPDPDQTVTNGQVTLTTEAEKVTVGLGYTSLARTPSLEVKTNATPTTQGQPIRIYEVVFKFFETVGASYGMTSTGTFDVLPFSAVNDPFGVAPSLFSGEKTIQPQFKYRDEDPSGSQVVVKTESVYPLTLVGLITRLQVGN